MWIVLGSPPKNIIHVLPSCRQDTQDFISSFHSDASLKRADYTAQDFSLQERVRAQVWWCSYPLWTAEVTLTSPLRVYACVSPLSSQLRAALYNIHDIFFEMPLADRLAMLQHDRELRAERKLREIVNLWKKNTWLQCCRGLFQLLSVSTLQERIKGAKEKVILSTATQRSLDRKKR